MNKNTYILRPAQRLLQADQFSHVFEHAKLKVHQPGFMILATPATQPRLGLIVAKKKIRRAHERNRFKRLARESFRLHQHQLPAFDLVIMAKPAALFTTNDDLSGQLQMAWQQLRTKSQRAAAQSSNNTLSPPGSSIKSKSSTHHLDPLTPTSPPSAQPALDLIRSSTP